MSQLTMATIPGFFDLDDSAIAGGQPLTDDSLLKISHNAKFAAVRPELIFMGFYANGNTVPPPVSAVDGYAYSITECTFIPVFAASRPPAGGFTPGQSSFPVLSSTNSGGGEIYRWQVDVNDATGVVSILVSYYVPGGTETPTTDGTVKVYCIATRASVNVSD
jgi:hypothetical protein